MTDIAKTSSPIQQESARFRSSVSEALLAKIGGDINFLLASAAPIGTILFSLLTESQFQDLTSTDWVLMQSLDISSSDLAVLTGITALPDARGLFLRGKNNGRADGKENPDGELALGTYSDDRFKSHDHPLLSSDLPETGGPIVHDDGSEFALTRSMATGLRGGAETSPKSLTVNIFVRIN